ncbi:MAG TPA: carotenoid oxygenase family protein, partial [Acidimicrobiales bacterium]|nr:carotenoid oxygenase family protein [Acidimicrobiales bacterium]
EEVTAVDVAVTGTIPDHLDGRYLRNGPNPIDADPATYHWFTGFGMVHGVRLRDGRAEWYRNRYVRSSDVAAALGEEWAGGPVHGGMDFAANTNVIGHAGRTFAIVEAGANPYELDDELGTLGVCDFDGTLPGGYTAHPKRDPQTGELHAVSYHWAWGNKVKYTVIDRDAHVRRIVDVETTGSPMLHDMSLTERYAVIYDLPVVFDLELAMTGVGLPYRWSNDYPARVGLLPREGDGDDVRWFDVEPCYVFHPLNAYDDGDRVVIELCRFERMFDAAVVLGPDGAKPRLDRWTIDTAAGKVLEEVVDDRGQDFPRVDERLVGRHHRYGYTVSPDRDGDFDPTGGGSLLRHDLVAGTSQARSFGPGRAPGEFVMVPAAADAAEDDGVVMGFVHDAARTASDLVLLDAATLETVAEVHLPTRVPYGFHGNWIAS